VIYSQFGSAFGSPIDPQIDNVRAAPALTSLPALAAALRRMDGWAYGGSVKALVKREPLVTAYQVQGGGSVAEEAASAVRVLATVADRMRRMRGAYGEWTELSTGFDAGAFFDMTPAQVHRFLHIHERVTTVHAVLYADLLLPSYQEAEAYWLDTFRVRYHLLTAFIQDGSAAVEEALAALEVEGVGEVASPDAGDLARFEAALGQMTARWERLLAVVNAIRAALRDDIRFWAISGAVDERALWQAEWAREPAPGLPGALTPLLKDVPTMTLATEFPLPLARQPGRLRRLRRHYLQRRMRRG
jgi:hypothetical protein